MLPFQLVRGERTTRTEITVATERHVQGYKFTPNRRIQPVSALISCLAIFSLLACSSSGSEATLPHASRARTVFECAFQSADDRNGDNQPDGWRRLRSRSYPAYIDAKIVSRDPHLARQGRDAQILMLQFYHAWKHGSWEPGYAPETIPHHWNALMDGVIYRNCFEVRMDGGAFESISRRFAIDAQLRYQLQSEVMCQDLVGHEANVELHLFNSAGEVVQVLATKPLSGSHEWLTVQTEIADLASIEGPLAGEIHIRVYRKPNGDGQGIVRFDNIRVAQLPSTKIAIDKPFNTTNVGQPVSIQFESIGLLSASPSARLEIIDVDNIVVYTANAPIDRGPMNDAHDSKTKMYVATKGLRGSKHAPTPKVPDQPWIKSVSNWKIPLNQPGYYRVRVAVDEVIYGETSLAVTNTTEVDGGGFGWSIEQLDEIQDYRTLVDLLRRSGVGWIKLPTWIDYRDTAQCDQLFRLLGSLKHHGIRTVGVLETYPASQQDLLGPPNDRIHAVSLLSHPDIWSESFAPLLELLNLKLDWLQIGKIQDRSFALSPSLHTQLTTVRKQLQSAGHDYKLAVGWDWHLPVNLSSRQDGESPPWNAIHYSMEQPLFGEHLAEHVTAVSTNRWHTWASITPLPSSEHSLQERVADLLRAMIAAKNKNPQALFIDHLFDDQLGLLSKDQRAGDLLIPWTRVVSAIATKSPLGSFELPQQSSNQLFSAGNDTVMILWNERLSDSDSVPLDQANVTEQVFLGEDIQAHDIWGREVVVKSIRLPSGSIVQELPVGRWPLIVSNVNRDVVRWQQEFQVLVDHISNHITNRGTLPIRLNNAFGTITSGKITAHSPLLTSSEPSTRTFELQPHAISNLDLPFVFKPDTSAGMHLLEFAFELHANKKHNFSIWKTVHVGHQDFSMKWSISRLTPQLVEATVEITNNTGKPTSFDCKFFPRNTAYARVQIHDAPRGVSLQTYRIKIPSGTASEEQPLWVRCEQMGTSRVLNYKIIESH